MNRHLPILFGVVLIWTLSFCAFPVQAQIDLITFDFAGLVGNELTDNSDAEAAGIAQSTISRGSGVTATNNADRFNSDDWTANPSIDLNDYLEFDISPQVGSTVSVTEIEIQHQRSGNGPRDFVVRISTDGFLSFTEIGGFTSPGTGVTVSTVNTVGVAELQAFTTPVDVRIYGFDATSGAGTWGPGDGGGNDLIVRGAVGCLITDISIANPTACNNNGTPATPVDDYFEADVTVTYLNPPGVGTIELTGADVVGGTTSAAVGSSPQTITGVRLAADGADVAITATFSADGACTYSETIAGSAVASCSSGEYYRSNVAPTGAWTTVASWEVSPDGIAGWTAATNFPTALNSQEVEIRTGDIITLAANVTIDNLIVNGQLTIETTGLLTVENGNPAGPDFQVNGTLVDNGSSGNGFASSSAGTWALAAAGTVTKTNNGSADVYRDRYHNGIVNMPAGATWNYQYTGNTVSTVATGMVYPNLNITGAHDFSNSLEIFRGASLGGMTVQGNLTIGSGATIYNNMGAPITVEGDLIIQGAFSNDRQGGASGTFFGNELIVQGNINNTGVLNHSFDDTGTPGIEGKLTMQGAAMGNGPGNTFRVNVLELNNASGISQSGTVNVAEELIFINGILQNGASELVLENTAANAITGAGSSQYISGYLRWNLAAGINYTFPVGQDGSACGYAPFTVSFAGTAPGDLLGYFEQDGAAFPGVNINCTATATNYLYDCRVGDWFLTPSSGTSYDYSVSFDIATNCPLCSGVEGFKIIRDGLTNDPDDCPTGLSVNLSTFSTPPAATEFEVYSSSVILPVELIDFSVRRRGEAALLTWTTVTELNNDYFVVERSADGRQFAELGRVAGAGTTYEQQHYQFIDQAPHPGLNYYRLRQVDYDGTAQLHQVAALHFPGSGSAIDLSPNPAADVLTIRLQDAGMQIKSLEITNAVGQSLQRIDWQTGEVRMDWNIAALPPGLYFLRTRGAGAMVAPFVKR